MRWIWIDKFVEFASKDHAAAVKNVTLAEDHLHDLYPGFPVLPESLMVEGMAQTAGILVGEAKGFAENVILAKVRRAEFTAEVRPGSQVRYDAKVESLEESAAATSGTVSCDGEKIGTVDLMFSHVNKSNRPEGIPEKNFVFTDQFTGLLDDFLQGTKAAGGDS